MPDQVRFAAAVLLIVGLTACSAPPVPSTAAAGARPAAQPQVPASAGGGDPTDDPADVDDLVPPVPPTASTSSISISSIVLAIGSSTATISTAEGPGFTLDREIDHAGAEPGPAHRVEGTTLVVEGCGLADCRFAYRITVPDGVAVTGVTGSGAVSVTGASHVDVQSDSAEVRLADIDGTTRVRSGSGAVSLVGLGGETLVETGSGAIRGDALGGPALVAESGSGSIDLTFAAVSTVVAESSSGAVRVRVAPGRYTVSADPDAEIGIVHDPAADAAISVTSASGPVSVGPAGG